MNFAASLPFLGQSNLSGAHFSIFFAKMRFLIYHYKHFIRRICSIIEYIIEYRQAQYFSEVSAPKPYFDVFEVFCQQSS